MTTAFWALAILALLTDPVCSTSGDFFTRVSSQLVPADDSGSGVIACAISCVQKDACVGFSYDSSCVLITDRALIPAALGVGVVYEMTDTTPEGPMLVAPAPAPAPAGPTPHWGGTGSLTCYSSDEEIAYMGTKATTVPTGDVCDAWPSSVPPFWSLGELSDDKFPENSRAAAANYCRDLGSHFGQPFCWAKSELTYCGIPQC